MVREETVGEAIERVPFGRFHWLLLATTGGMWAAMSLGILGISFALPALVDAWGLSAPVAGALGSASLVGMFAGNVLCGRAADRVGRKRTLLVTVTTFSVFTAATALATGVYTAAALRFCTGVGLGGTLVVGASYLSELLPAENRGRYVTFLEVAFSVGSLAVVAVAWVVFAYLGASGRVLGVADWRVFFATGVVPLVLVFVVYAYLPRSPYFLAQAGAGEAAADELAAIASFNDDDAGALPERLSVADSPSVGFRRLFHVDLRGTTVLLASLWFGVNLAYYGIFTWLPTTVAAAGYAAHLYRRLLVVACFQLAGQLTAAYLIELVGRKRTLGALLVLGGAATLVFAVAIPGGPGATASGGAPTLFAVGLYAMAFALFGAWAVLYAYTAEVFPTRVRSTGLGFTGSVGKVAATVGPVAFGAFAGFGYLVVLAPLAVVLVAVGLGALAFGRETRGETLV